MIMTYIPADIIHTIIDELSNNKLALQRCSLVSRAFLPPCRAYLFSNITLDHPRPCRGLYRALNNNPSLVCYIRELSVVANAQPEFRGRDWVTIENTLPDVLQMLHDLRSFTLRNTSTRPLPWDVLPTELRAALIDLAHSPVSSITLDHLANPPVNDIARFVHLKRLRWINMYIDLDHYTRARKALGGSAGPFKYSRGTGQLEYLEIVGSARSGHLLADTLCRPHSPLHLRNLRQLVLRGNCAFAAEVTSAAAHSLEHLTWHQLGAEEEGPYASAPIELGVLRSITIETKFARERPSDPLPALVAALRAVPVMECAPLEKLVIALDFTGVWRFSVTARDVQDIAEYAVWREFDEVLTSGVFPRLTQFRVALRISDVMGEFKPQVALQMPKLAGRGVLDVK